MVQHPHQGGVKEAHVESLEFHPRQMVTFTPTSQHGVKGNNVRT